MGENIRIISFQKAKENYDEKHCDHSNIEIDPTLWAIRCADCGKILDPIGWMVDMAKEERITQFKINELRKEYDKLCEEIKQKNRCKCEYCGHMTHIVK